MSLPTHDPAAPLAAAHALLSRVTLNDYIASRPPTTVVTVSDRMLLQDLLHLFDSRAILSAPVFSAATPARCIGFVSVADVLRAVLSWASIGAAPSPAARAEGLARAGARLATQRVRDIPRANDGALLWRAADGGMSLLDVVRSGFLRGGAAPPVHRIAVYDVEGDDGGPTASTSTAGDGSRAVRAAAAAAAAGASPALDGAAVRFVAVVTQSDVVAFCAKHVGELGPIATMPVGDAGVASSPVVSVPHDMPAAHAFAALFARPGPVSSAAVLDTRGGPSSPPGAIAASLSVSDLRGLRPSGLDALAGPVLDFIRTRPGPPRPPPSAAAGPAATWGVRGADDAPRPPAAVAPLCVAPGTGLGEVMVALAAARAHRAYVVDGEGRPDGILTMTDLLSLLSR